MRSHAAIAATVIIAVLGAAAAWSSRQIPVRQVEEHTLREYAGVYSWEGGGYLYVQLWNELAGTNQLTAFDESGDLRALYAGERDRFFAGPGAAVTSSVESTVEFRRDAEGRITSLMWQRRGAAPRIARRTETETHLDVRFPSGAIELAGTLIKPRSGSRHPAIVLVHGSGAQDRHAILPFARFLVRHGMAVLGYDKRGVGASRGDWKLASIEDLAADVVAACDYLKTRDDIDASQVGLLGVSQAGWVIPLAAVRANDLAFLISVSGAAVPPAESALDHAQNEMRAGGMKPDVVSRILALMKLQYQFARTGEGWNEYLAARQELAARLGSPPGTFPPSPDDPHWDFMRRLYFYDPAPTLRQLQVPTLALFGELDNNILADKNTAAWEAALKASGNRDYTLQVLPGANHVMLEATRGNNAEIPSLQRFVPAYFTTVRDWLATRVQGFAARQ